MAVFYQLPFGWKERIANLSRNLLLNGEKFISICTNDDTQTIVFYAEEEKGNICVLKISYNLRILLVILNLFCG